MTDLFKIKIESGWAMYRDLFSEQARRVLDSMIDSQRSALKLPTNTLRGGRFNDNAGILARLESRFSEEEFMGCPGPCIDKALIDAAQSDWWYDTQKDYGYDSLTEEDWTAENDEEDGE